ncbi:MAG: hypothetical protein QOK37_2598 [Thermoanaerobaculia bacterium]|jgi:hypothetical protein|nr:hypothetical protein [Thermoanaerobaculia bacterium]
MVDKKPEAYEEIADYWDAHELSDDNSEPCEIEVQCLQQKIEEESPAK